jgi:hypothetical protein
MKFKQVLKGFNYKTKGLNKFFSESNINVTLAIHEINNTFIKQSKNFDIIKDNILGTYYMKFNNLMIIHLNEDLLTEFTYLYNNSPYLFHIYETISKKIKTYHIICVSNILDEKFRTFLYGNECLYKWYILTELYGSCLIINRYYNQQSTIYKFIKPIGKGTVNNNIKYNLQILMNVINNNYLKYLPTHFLKI